VRYRVHLVDVAMCRQPVSSPRARLQRLELAGRMALLDRIDVEADDPLAMRQCRTHDGHGGIDTAVAVDREDKIAGDAETLLSVAAAASSAGKNAANGIPRSMFGCGSNMISA
jgi:hypothetical protein